MKGGFQGSGYDAPDSPRAKKIGAAIVAIMAILIIGGLICLAWTD